MRALATCLALGVVAGTLVSTRVPVQLLLVLLGVFQIAIAARLWRASSQPTRRPPREAPDIVAQSRLRFPGAGSLLFATGGISSIGGVAGATLMTPYFTRAGIEYPQAAALSTFFGCVIGAAGFISYGLLAHPAQPVPMSIGYVSLPACASMAAGSLCLVRCGARLSRRLPKKMLTRGFCCFLVVSGLKPLNRPFGLAGRRPGDAPREAGTHLALGPGYERPPGRVAPAVLGVLP